MRGFVKSLGLLFVQALAVGLAEQSRRGVHAQYSSAPGRVTGNAIRRKRTSSRYNGAEGARATERRCRQYAEGLLRFHAYGIEHRKRHHHAA